MEKIVDTLLNHFDIGYMLSINILTYIFIKTLDYFNKQKKVKLLVKRLMLILSTLICVVIYYFVGDINKTVLINSTIAAPVFYSWVMKPILKKYNLGYFKENK